MFKQIFFFCLFIKIHFQTNRELAFSPLSYAKLSRNGHLGQIWAVTQFFLKEKLFFGHWGSLHPHASWPISALSSQHWSPQLTSLAAILMFPLSVCRWASFPATAWSWSMTRSHPVFRALCPNQVLVSLWPEDWFYSGCLSDLMSVCCPRQCVKSTGSWWRSWGRSWSPARRPRSCASEASWRRECSAATWGSICTAPIMRVNDIFKFDHLISHQTQMILLSSWNKSFMFWSCYSIQYAIFICSSLSFCVLAHHDSLHAVPQVVKSCTEFIEKHGVVDGIYRLSGISSNIQKLRCEKTNSLVGFQVL